MKITYKLFSAEYQEGKELAVVRDMQQANILEPYYYRVYNNDRFRVTVKYGRQKTERLVGYFR